MDRVFLLRTGCECIIVAADRESGDIYSAVPPASGHRAKLADRLPELMIIFVETVPRGSGGRRRKQGALDAYRESR